MAGKMHWDLVGSSSDPLPRPLDPRFCERSFCRYDAMLARFRDSDPRHVHDSAPDSI